MLERLPNQVHRHAGPAFLAAPLITGEPLTASADIAMSEAFQKYLGKAKPTHTEGQPFRSIIKFYGKEYVGDCVVFVCEEPY